MTDYATQGRPGRVPLPPADINSREGQDWMLHLALFIEELGALLGGLLPDGVSRDALINAYRENGGNTWEAIHLDSFHFLGTATWDGVSVYEAGEQDPAWPWTGGDGSGMGTPPPSEPRPGAFAYFRADGANTGPAFLEWPASESNPLTEMGSFEIVAPDGSSLTGGEIPDGAMVAIVFDCISNTQLDGDPPPTGNFQWRMLAVLNASSDADTLDGHDSTYFATAASVTSEASTRAAADTALTAAALELETLVFSGMC